jgi:hypothetical protein
MQPEQLNRVQLLFSIWNAKGYLQALLNWELTLTVSVTPGLELISVMEAYEKTYKKLTAEQLNKPPVYPEFGEIQRVINSAKTFETVLCAELNTLAAYGVTQKGIYSTSDLIERAERILPEPVLARIDSKTIEEIRQSGRCLAFDNATASAFHIMRATETVIHEYYISVCKPKPKPTKRLENWGAYIAELQKSSKSEVKEVIAMLQQIKDRHRNLIMHPEIVLSPDEAFTLFEIAQGAIIAMADKLP